MYTINNVHFVQEMILSVPRKQRAALRAEAEALDAAIAEATERFIHKDQDESPSKARRRWDEHSPARFVQAVG